MDYIIVDFEWNQPKNEEKRVTTPIVFDSELIEIGAVKLNSEFEKTDELRVYIKPVFYPELHGRIARLTNITGSDIASAEGFPEAYSRFLDWCGPDFAFMTWGPTDIPVLMDNLIMHGIPHLPLPECYDLQRIFDREILRENRQCSLEKAMEIMKLTPDKAHDALNDARNTAAIANCMDLDILLEDYPILYADYSQFSVPERIQTAEAWRVYETITCPWCGEEAEPDAFKPGRTAYARCRCPEGDCFYVSLSQSKHGESYLIKRTAVLMNEDLWYTFEGEEE